LRNLELDAVGFCLEKVDGHGAPFIPNVSAEDRAIYARCLAPLKLCQELVCGVRCGRLIQLEWKR